MSTTKNVTVWCDVPDCHGWIGQEDTAVDARRVARRFGWARRHGKDLCPEHSDERPDTKSPAGGQT